MDDEETPEDGEFGLGDTGQWSGVEGMLLVDEEWKGGELSCSGLPCPAPIAML